MEWFRMYTEARNDAKLRTLTDSQHRVWFNLLCLAAEQKNRGTITVYDMELLAIEVSAGNVELLSETIRRLQKLRIVSVEDDTITFINFRKRQYTNPSDRPDATRERKRRQREREKEAGHECHEMSRDVTSSVTTTEQSRAEADQIIAEAAADSFTIDQKTCKNRASNTENEKKSKKDSAAAATEIFHRELKRTLTPLESEQLAGWLENDGPDLTLEALRRAVLQGKPTFRYIAGILQRWRDAGLRTIQAVMERDPVFGHARADPARADPAAEKKRLAEGVRAAREYLRLTLGEPDTLTRAQVVEFFRENDYGPDVAAAVLAEYGGDERG